MNSTIPQVSPILKTEHLEKRYGEKIALADVNLSISAGHVVGLLGRNGSGKTTLLHLAAGITLPSAGSAQTLGQRTDLLDTPELTRLGLVMQEARFVEWMTVKQHLDFTASFYPSWDRVLQQRLVELLEVPQNRTIAELSTGDRQKVAILLGVCHRPSLLLLDEPMSSLDPIARARMLDVLLEFLSDEQCTVVISSHLLSDIEKAADWIVALEMGRVVADLSFDELQESYAEWTVTIPEGAEIGVFAEPFIVAEQRSGRMARLTVHTSDPRAVETFALAHGVNVQSRFLSLEEIFPILLKTKESAR